MKKIALMALVILAGASFSPAMAGDKKDKKKKKTEPVAVVVKTVDLNTKTDSVSYAMGMEATDGLIPYLIQQLHVDTAYMDKFIEGFEQAFRNDDASKAVTAFGAGTSIAQMVRNNMVNSASKRMEGVVDSVSTEMFGEGFLASLFTSISADPKTEVEVNLPNQTVTNLATGESEHFDINSYKKHCLMNGLDDIDYLLQNKNKTEQWEQQNK